MISINALEQTDTTIKSMFESIKYNRDFAKNNPDYFYPCSFLCFIGGQGSGKTLTAVNYVYNLMRYYPKCILVTNIDLKDYPIDNERVFRFTCADDLLKYKNGKLGVIFLIDEIHLYLGSQKGANNINPEVLQAICQQRKQRIHIVSTTQYFAQLNINLRRHFDSIILCESKFFNLRQKLSLINRDSISSSESSSQTLDGQVQKTIKYWRSPKMFDRYDTYAIINSNLAVGLEREVTNYDNSNIRLSGDPKLLSSLSNIGASNSANIQHSS